MNPFAEQDVYVNLEAKLPTNSGTGDEELFTDELLAEMSTKNGCPVKPIKYATKQQSSKTKTGNHFSNTVEKSPRRARRNARERGRKARLNAAFQVLKSIVSQTLDSSTHDRKLTQVEILRLAKNYICSLTTVLQACNDDATTSYQNNSSFSQPFLNLLDSHI